MPIDKWFTFMLYRWYPRIQSRTPTYRPEKFDALANSAATPPYASVKEKQILNLTAEGDDSTVDAR